MKWIITLLIIGALGGAGWWYYQSSHETAPEYQTAAVTRGDLTNAVTATGQLGPVLNVQVGSQISGIVEINKRKSKRCIVIPARSGSIE